MKSKKNILKTMFRICLVMALAFVVKDLGSVSASAATRASYKIIRKEEVRKYGNMSATYLYQLPQLKGNSAAIKKINKSLRADYKKTLGNKKWLFEYFEWDKHKTNHQKYGSKYYATVRCTTEYNRKGYICFHFTSRWYAGGVGNYSEYGLTYRLKDGKKMGIQDVIAGSRGTVKQRIASTYARKVSYRGYEPIMRMKYSDFKFYIKPGKKVVVCFGPYQPMGGNNFKTITMKGKMK